MVKIKKNNKSSNREKLHSNEYGVISTNINEQKERLTVLYKIGSRNKTAIISFENCKNYLIEENEILEHSTTRLFLREERSSITAPIETVEYTPKELFKAAIVTQVPKWTADGIETVHTVYNLGQDMVSTILDKYLKNKYPKKKLALNQEILDKMKNNRAVRKSALQNTIAQKQAA